jgi:hypothetical protein
VDKVKIGRYEDQTGRGVKAGIYALVLGLVYYTAFTYLLHLWENEDFSYGYLVPFFVVFLIGKRGKGLPSFLRILHGKVSFSLRSGSFSTPWVSWEANTQRCTYPSGLSSQALSGFIWGGEKCGPSGSLSP